MSADRLPSPSLERNPELDQWLRIQHDGFIRIFSGKVELGQKNHAALALIAAEELEVDVRRIVMAPVDTRYSPDEQYTSGSSSMQESGVAVRHVAAQARSLLLTMAAQRFQVPVERLQLADGEIRVAGGGENRWTSYWELMGDRPFNCLVSAHVALRPAHTYRLVGKRNTPWGFAGLVKGEPCFVQDIELPGMLHARVIRPPAYHAMPAALAADSLAGVNAMPGVLQLVHSGRFFAIIARREEQAVEAAAKLSAMLQWQDNTGLDDEDIFYQLRNKPRKSLLVRDGVPVDEEIPAISVPDGSVRTLRASYRRPYHMHASIGPSAAAAHWIDGKLTIWTHSQGVYPLRAGIAQVLGIDETCVRVVHVPGPGCYGHNGADDAALDAAIIALEASQRPVLLKWSREDEHRWEPYGSAMLIEMQASLDGDGELLSWSHETFSDTHVTRSRDLDGASRLLGAWHLQKPWPAPEAKPNLRPHGGIHRNADPLYVFPNKRIVKHLVRELPLRASATRSLGAYANIFALESFVDEIAYETGIDPLDFRLSYLRDERARAVLKKVAEISSWGGTAQGDGRGLAFAQYKNAKTYAAVVIDIDVDEYGNISLKHAFIAADAGQIVDPDGICSQLEGGFMQAVSWTLKEEVRFDRTGITSTDWLTYPILGFADIPEIETALINRPGQPYLGAGEATQGPTPGAIANAVFSATGIRVRTIPFTAENVRKAAAQQDMT